MANALTPFMGNYFTREAANVQARGRTPEYRKNELSGFYDSLMDNVFGTAALIDKYILRRPGSEQEYASWDELRDYNRQNLPGYQQGDMVGNVGAAFDPIMDTAGGLAARVAPLVGNAVRGGGGRPGLLRILADEGGTINGAESGASAWRGKTSDEFLGSPKITSDKNASDLRPRVLGSVESVEPEKFLDSYTVKMNKDGAAVFDGDKVIASYNFGDTLVVDPKYRRRGIGEELVYRFRTRYPEKKIAETRTRSSQKLQEKVWDRIQKENNSR